MWCRRRRPRLRISFLSLYMNVSPSICLFSLARASLSTFLFFLFAIVLRHLPLSDARCTYSILRVFISFLACVSLSFLGGTEEKRWKPTGWKTHGRLLSSRSIEKQHEREPVLFITSSHNARSSKLLYLSLSRLPRSAVCTLEKVGSPLPTTSKAECPCIALLAITKPRQLHCDRLSRLCLSSFSKGGCFHPRLYLDESIDLEIYISLLHHYVCLWETAVSLLLD